MVVVVVVSCRWFGSGKKLGIGFSGGLIRYRCSCCIWSLAVVVVMVVGALVVVRIWVIFLQ